MIGLAPPGRAKNGQSLFSGSRSTPIASPHDASIGSRDAFVGRVLDKRVLDSFFAPVLRKWGFTPHIEA
jgi:hypothetical protein